MEELLHFPNRHEDINDEDLDHLQQGAELIIEPDVDTDNLSGKLFIATRRVFLDLLNNFLG